MGNAGRWGKWYADGAPQPYADETTYRIAEQWLAGLDVEDWGCGYGWFRHHHRGGYLGVDGTAGFADVVADLTEYRSETPGLLLRHVLEHDTDWPKILDNAAASATEVLVVVVFTPKSDVCEQVGWTDDLGVPDLTIPHQELTAVCPEWVTYRTESQYQTERVYVRR